MDKIIELLNSLGGIASSLYFVYCVYRWHKTNKQPSNIEMLVMIMLMI